MGCSCKETQCVQVPKCLYMSISLMLYFNFVKSVDKWKRLSEEIVALYVCSPLVKGYSGDLGLL